MLVIKNFALGRLLGASFDGGEDRRTPSDYYRRAPYSPVLQPPIQMKSIDRETKNWIQWRPTEMQRKWCVLLFSIAALTTSACIVQSEKARQEVPVPITAPSQNAPELKPEAAPTSIAYVQALDRKNWLVADFDRVLRTGDGGKTWTASYGNRKVAASGQRVRGLSFIDAKTGFLIFDREVLRSDDGGVSWSEVGKFEFDAASCHFTDVLHGWAAGRTWVEDFISNPRAPQYIGAVFSTKDGGQTWQQQRIDLPEGYFEEGTRWYLSDVFFVDEMAGWAVGFGVIFWTIDGGASWHVADAWKGQYQCVRFLDREFGWATQREGTEFSLTTDGGKHWTLLDGAPAYGSWPTSAVFITRKHGFASVVSIYETKDGGLSWILRGSTDGTVKGYTYLGRARDGALVSLGLNNNTIIVLVSTDDGTTWR